MLHCPLRFNFIRINTGRYFTNKILFFNNIIINYSHSKIKFSKKSCGTVQNLKFVPNSKSLEAAHLFQLQNFILEHSNIFVLTGAGISTESGIPDYRSEGVGRYATSKSRPIQFSDFINSAAARQRYWARNYFGWPQFSSFQPNRSHFIISDWEKAGKVNWLVTQNVDALHYKAGSKNVTELHGSAHRVICLSCNLKISRHIMQDLITEHNPGWSASATSIAPDGDVDLTLDQIQNFKVPECPECKGILKPEITFFGDNVPKPVVHLVLEKLFESDAILVIGSSLEVFSGFRFISRAKEKGMKLAIINIGPTRADKLADIKVSAQCGDVLEKLSLNLKK